MLFKKLTLCNFRNIAGSEIEFSDRLNFLIGSNGQGKTNILEALHLFSHGDSFRYCDNSTLISNGQKESFLKLAVESNKLKYDLSLFLQSSKKKFLQNDKKVTAVELRKNFPSVLFSPESLSVVKEASDIRRNLIDDLLITVSPRNSELISEYRKAHKMRNKILKDFVNGTQDRVVTDGILNSLNPIFLRLACELTWERIKAINLISKDFNDAMRYISQDNSVEISVEYVVSSENLIESSFEKVLRVIQNRIENLKESELAAGVSLVGPHKHLITFLYNQNDSRFYCSQGQQRAIILAFKIAQIVYHRKVHDEYPALMLDDVLSELDSIKKDALISFLREINTQTFITTTDLHLPEIFQLGLTSVYKIESGNIHRF
jgi:DNA replication and repair protein RecF